MTTVSASSDACVNGLGTIGCLFCRMEKGPRSGKRQKSAFVSDRDQETGMVDPASEVFPGSPLTFAICDTLLTGPSTFPCGTSSS